MWQAEHVSALLTRSIRDSRSRSSGMTTKGDKILDAPLAKVGGKGLFVKELEQGMLEGVADIAVHSMKDVPVDFPEGLHLAVIMDREDPRDAFVSNRYEDLDSLPQACLCRHLEPAPPVSARRPASRPCASSPCAATSTPGSPSSTPGNTTPSSWPPPA